MGLFHKKDLFEQIYNNCITQVRVFDFFINYPFVINLGE